LSPATRFIILSALFSPLSLRGLTLRNRIIVSPMCQYSAENAAASAWHMMIAGLAHAGRKASCHLLHCRTPHDYRVALARAMLMRPRSWALRLRRRPSTGAPPREHKDLFADP